MKVFNRLNMNYPPTARSGIFAHRLSLFVASISTIHRPQSVNFPATLNDKALRLGYDSSSSLVSAFDPKIRQLVVVNAGSEKPRLCTRRAPSLSRRQLRDWAGNLSATNRTQRQR